MRDEDYDYEEEYVEEQESLSGALTDELGQTPWYVSSVAVHVMIFLIFFLIPPERKDEKERRVVIRPNIVEPEEIEEPKEEEKPDIEERPEIETEIESTIDAPVVVTTDVEITDHFETKDEMDDQSARGEPDLVADFDSEDRGTPALMGVGNTGGSGGGGIFGTRMGGGRRRAVAIGGGGGTGNALDWALRWLKEHQEPDGSWDVAKYQGGAHHGDDESVTALALLAFLGAGNSNRFGRYKEVVQSATYWLLQRQDANGCIGKHRYTGGITTMAIAEAYGMGDKGIRAQAQKAVDWACKSQNADGSWDYSPNSNRSDLSVTGWWIMGLKSAKVAGLHVPYENMERALKFCDMMTKADGHADYTPGKSHSNRMTAVSLTCRQFLGVKRDDAKVVATAQRTLRSLPGGNHDFYLTYYQSLGLFQMGVRSDYWKKFNPVMKSHLLGTQVKQGTFKENNGSWNPESDKYGPSWGRVGQTALGALMLEVYFRYHEVEKMLKK